jgi:hypothetical protein
MVGLLGPRDLAPHRTTFFVRPWRHLEKALAIELTGDLVEFISRLSLATLSAIEDADYTFQPTTAAR